MKKLSAGVAVILFFAVARAEMTNELLDKEVQGRALAGKIWEQQPAENFTNTGVLKIRDQNGRRTESPIEFQIKLTGTGWVNRYLITGTNAGSMSHAIQIERRDGTNQYGDALAISFAGSDFRLGDLGLEFFHWPQQKVLKREVHGSRDCTVLESTNPNPSANSYSRVVSWIDAETLGIVEADAYDAKGKELKIFTPKDFKKVNGRWQVQTFLMENVQTGSRSRLEFDLKK